MSAQHKRCRAWWRSSTTKEPAIKFTFLLRTIKFLTTYIRTMCNIAMLDTLFGSFRRPFKRTLFCPFFFTGDFFFRPFLMDFFNWECSFFTLCVEFVFFYYGVPCIHMHALRVFHACVRLWWDNNSSRVGVHLVVKLARATRAPTFIRARMGEPP